MNGDVGMHYVKNSFTIKDTSTIMHNPYLHVYTYSDKALRMIVLVSLIHAYVHVVLLRKRLVPIFRMMHRSLHHYIHSVE